MLALLKKEYRLSIILILAFTLFLFTVDKTSAQLVYLITDVHFYYEQQAFLKITYLVLLMIAYAFLVTLNKNENNSIEIKSLAFRKFVVFSVLSFFPGWAIHLYWVSKTILNHQSFRIIEHQFWLYNAADFTLFIGFCIAAVLFIRPALHPKLEKK